jgi:hypothetical protein
MLSRGMLTIICITFIIPHSICREADLKEWAEKLRKAYMTRLRARLPYIMELMVEEAGPWEAERVAVAPKIED